MVLKKGPKKLPNFRKYEPRNHPMMRRKYDGDFKSEVRACDECQHRALG